MSPEKLHWRDIEDLGLRLAETYPSRDPLSVRFTELRRLVESLPDFEAEPDHPCNEAILEAVQAAWVEEQDERDKGDSDDGGSPYKPASPYRPR
jgi:FeS assembly protein IscX